MTIEVLTRHREDRMRTARAFADIVEAARYALCIANDHGLQTAMSASTDPPIEVCVIADGKMILALKVQIGGLVPSKGSQPRRQ